MYRLLDAIRLRAIHEVSATEKKGQPAHCRAFGFL